MGSASKHTLWQNPFYEIQVSKVAKLLDHDFFAAHDVDATRGGLGGQFAALQVIPHSAILLRSTAVHNYDFLNTSGLHHLETHIGGQETGKTCADELIVALLQIGGR